MIFVNQLCFVYSLEFAKASTVSLLFGYVPDVRRPVRDRLPHVQLQRSFWIGAGLTFAGVALIAAGAGGGLVSGWKGDLLAIALADHLGGLHRRDRAAHAPVLAVPDQRGRARARLAAARAREHPADQPPGLRTSPGWCGSASPTRSIGPLFLTNILWFTAVNRVGAPRAAIFNNLQPFFGVLFALLILSESIHGLEIVGGVLIFVGIAYERVRRAPAGVAAGGAR